MESKVTESQNHQILQYLQNGNKITPIEALNLFGCFRLGARIWDLREKGNDIISKLVTVGKKRLAQYELNT